MANLGTLPVKKKSYMTARVALPSRSEVCDGLQQCYYEAVPMSWERHFC